jgi:formylglycine-generating enzyme
VTRRRAAPAITSLLGGLFALSACRARPPIENRTSDAGASSAKHSSISAPETPIQPRQGMVWIPGGALVAGSPEDSLPRLADREMPGEQVILKGFYIDVFPYPDEEGAIPLTNATRDAAATLCAERGKRLCSELEWERACKGPQNRRYEYGDAFRVDRCGMGRAPALRPVGLRVACRSDFGVRDMHGGAWEWTKSPWGRGSDGALVALRGGNSSDGELVGRCANAEPSPPAVSSGNIGFRCCAGPANVTEVALNVQRGPALEVRERGDRELLQRMLALLPEDAKHELEGRGAIVADRSWLWRPIGNEELTATRLCSGLGQRPGCGVLVSRVTLGRPNVLLWASSNHWSPNLEIDRDPHDLWMIGGDELGNVQRLIEYRSGTLKLGSEEHRARPRSSAKN